MLIYFRAWISNDGDGVAKNHTEAEQNAVP